MDMLTAAGVGPATAWPPKSFALNMIRTPVGPIITRYSQDQYEEYFACLEAASREHAALEKNMNALAAIAMKKQTIMDKRSVGVAAGKNSPVGHSLLILASLLMQSGAYLPRGFKELLLENLLPNDAFTRHEDDPLRPLIIKGFRALIVEYVDKWGEPFEESTATESERRIRVTRLVREFGPWPMFWQGEPDDGPWEMAIEDMFGDGMCRESFVREPPTREMSFTPPTAEETARMHAKNLERSQEEKVKKKGIGQMASAEFKKKIKQNVQAALRTGTQPPDVPTLDLDKHNRESTTGTTVYSGGGLEKPNDFEEIFADEYGLAGGLRGPLTFQVVRIVGLASRSDLNGIISVACAFDVAKGRYQVLVPRHAPPHWSYASHHVTSIAVKPANLEDLAAAGQPMQEDAA